LTIDGLPATSGVPSAPIDLTNELNRAIPIVVTAGNRTTNAYIVTIRRDPPPAL
jgi:hypothetical protein